MVSVLQTGDNFGRGLPSREFAEEFFDVLDLQRALLQTVLPDVILHGHGQIDVFYRPVIIHGRLQKPGRETMRGPPEILAQPPPE